MESSKDLVAAEREIGMYQVRIAKLQEKLARAKLRIKRMRGELEILYGSVDSVTLQMTLGEIGLEGVSPGIVGAVNVRATRGMTYPVEINTTVRPLNPAEEPYLVTAKLNIKVV